MKFNFIILCCFISLAVESKYITDDSNAAPAQWRWCSRCSPADIGRLTKTGYRIVDINLVSASPLRLTTVLVRNTGTYGQAFWWYYGLDAATVAAKLTLHKARITRIVPYLVSGRLLFTVVLTPNTGANGKAWWWWYGVTPSFIGKELNKLGARIVDVKPYSVGRFGTRYAVVMIKNAGSDGRVWWWYYNVPLSFVGTKLNEFSARLMRIVPQPGSSGKRFTVVMERSPAKWWWYFGKTYAQLTRLTAKNKARLFQAVSYKTRFLRFSRTLYAGIMISND